MNGGAIRKVTVNGAWGVGRATAVSLRRDRHEALVLCPLPAGCARSRDSWTSPLPESIPISWESAH